MKNFIGNPKYHRIHKIVEKQTNQRRISWKTFIVARRFIEKPKNLGQKGCVAWRPFIAARQFLGRSLETTKNNVKRRKM